MNKLTRDLLVRLFEDDPYKDISKFKREMEAFDDPEEFYDLIWDDAYFLIEGSYRWDDALTFLKQIYKYDKNISIFDALSIKKDIKTIKRTIILSNYFLTLKKKDHYRQAVYVYHYLSHFMEKHVELLKYDKKCNILNYSFITINHYFNSNPNTLIQSFNIYLIVKLQMSLFNKLMEDKDFEKKFIFPWSTKNHKIPFLLYKDGFETSKHARDLLVYLAFIFSHNQSLFSENSAQFYEEIKNFFQPFYMNYIKNNLSQINIVRTHHETLNLNLKKKPKFSEYLIHIYKRLEISDELAEIEHEDDNKNKFKSLLKNLDNYMV